MSILDRTTDDRAYAVDRLEREAVIWFGSVTPDGRPQAFPVWFLWEDGEILIYSLNAAQRNDNIVSNPHVTLHLNANEHGGDVVVLEGEARIDEGAPPAVAHAAYLEKYSAAMASMGMSPERFTASYDVRVRVRPSRVRIFRGS